MAAFRTLDDLDVAGRRVLVRVDFNVPLENGRVSDATRIERSLPTIRELAEKRARVVLLSHLGRPKGKRDPKASLEPVARALAEALPERRVVFAPECIGDEARAAVENLGEGEVALLENLRFHAGEEANDEDFAKALAGLGELYVDDAFAAAHRAHASVERLPRLLPAAAGRLMQAELESLTAALEDPKPPVAAVIGGAKVSTKLDLLENLLAKVDVIILGGGMANTFLEAKGVAIGASLAERDMAETARALLARAETSGRAGSCEILLPTDAVVAARPEPGVETRVVAIREVPEDSMILDVGPRTVEAIEARLSDCRTLLWNGPLGLFEVAPFDQGTSAVARRAAELTRDGKLFSVAGGGDTLAALAKAGADADFSYLSTAGGAFLEWLEGKTLPGVAALEAAAR